MKIDAPIKLVGQLLDLPIIDKDEKWCGIVDDVELSGRPGRELRLAALLVGPGAYEGRMPAWLFRLVRLIAGDQLVRVPAAEIVEVGAVVKLRSTARELKLGKAEDRARRWIPRIGAM